MKRKYVLTAAALMGLFLIAVGSYFALQIFREDLRSHFLNESLSMIHRAMNDPADSVDQGLVDLHEQNPDCIYWIRIPDTEIDYPVMYRPQDKDYYLTRDFHQEYSVHGSLYLSEMCDPDASDNLIIYGHHMQDGSMFAGLEAYKQEDFYLSHKSISLETLSGHDEYEVIAAFSVSVYTGHDFEYYAFTDAADEAEFDSFLSECHKRSYYKTGRTAVYGQRLLTLSTCEYSHKNGRMVILAAEKDKEKTDAN